MTVDAGVHANFAAIHADQFRLSAHLVQPGFDLVELASDARLQLLGMQSVENQKAADELILAEFVDDARTGLAGLKHDFQNSFQAGSVQIHQKLHQFLGGGTRCGICDSFQIMHQSADLLHALLKLFIVIAHDPP